MDSRTLTAPDKPVVVHDVFDDTDDEVSEDSDFEDPDELEVPGGGKNLKTMQNINRTTSFTKPGNTPHISICSSGPTMTSSPVSVLKSPKSRSLLLQNNGNSEASIRAAMNRAKDEAENGIEVLNVIPGINSSRTGSNLGHSIPRYNNRGFGSGSLNSLSQMMSSSILAAQDPYYNMALAMSSANPNLAALHKSMDGNALSRMMNMSPYMMNSHLSSQLMRSNSHFPSPLSQMVGSTNRHIGGHLPMGAGTLQSRQMPNLWNQDSAARMAAMGAAAAAAKEDEEEAAAAEDEEDMGVIETYSNYKPSKLNLGMPHPDPVVETASLASVEPPDIWYNLVLPEATILERKLSALQLEAITYACQQHEKFLPDKNRAGFLIGDGAGVGKGRTIAGLILENYLRGRKRAIWISVSNDLKYDAERDMSDVGAPNINVVFLSKMKYGKINSSINGNIKKGIIYSTYSALIGESQSGGKYNTRLKQLLHWCGDDYDGLIVFDECHRAKNLCPSGASKPTKTGQTVLELQLKLPKARIIYASATGASEPKHMAYMVRLGIWGPGSPFKSFNQFLAAVEKRGVGAMEIVAMDMKLRGMYIARQLSFQDVTFRIDEVELSDSLRSVYNRSVDLWVNLLHKFEEAAELVDADKKMRKTMWGQFWSSHQRFFKYLCIASKVPHVVNVVTEVLETGKCVVIGLQSTGEARTLEAVDKDEELTDFVSTAKGVVLSLVEKHFPAPDRNKINRLLGLDQNSISKDSSLKTQSILPPTLKRKRHAASQRLIKKHKQLELDEVLGGAASSDDCSAEGSDFEISEVEEDEDDEDFEELDEIEEEDEEDFNPFVEANSDDDDEGEAPWTKRKQSGSKRGGGSVAATKRATVPKVLASKTKTDPFAHLAFGKEGLNGARIPPPSHDNVERAIAMKESIINEIEELGKILPANTLDQLIDELGGPTKVAEMTGRKGRIVQDSNGDVRYESRCGADTTLETLNLTEKNRFMDGLKNIAIISEAASSGISLQADRRVKNRKRRVHMTLELPWSADRAVQQFGRTHRSNQVSAPEYVLLISDLAGEFRFASIVAKRLESLGALTHGDRRATESRDLSRFNIDNKYGRSALDATFKAIMGYDRPIVKPPTDYKGDFFKDIADGLVGVGLITQSEDLPGVLTLDKGCNDMSKFLNRILGLTVERQNALFQYFSDTLSAIIIQAKRSGRYDQGILDVGLTGEDHVELVKTHTFTRLHATGTAKIELHVLQVERGMSWDAAVERWSVLDGRDEGFFLSLQVRNEKKTAILAIQNTRKDAALEITDKKSIVGAKKKESVFYIYRPNTGQQVKQETMTELKKKYSKVSRDEAEPHWNSQFKASVTKCSHAYWRGKCKNVSLGLGCEVGLRKKTYNVLAGSVLSVWNQVEAVLTNDGQRKGTNSRMQVVRLKLECGRRIVGTLIPNSAMSNILDTLSEGAEEAEEILY